MVQYHIGFPFVYGV